MITPEDKVAILQIQEYIKNKSLQTKGQDFILNPSDLMKTLVVNLPKLERLLDMVKNHSDGKIDWKQRKINYTPVAKTDDPYPSSKEAIQWELFIYDTSKIDEYFSSIIFKLEADIKEIIIIDREKGILNTNGTKKYSIRGKRLELILKLLDGSYARMKDIEKITTWSDQVISQTIADINIIFQNKFDTSKNIIAHNEASGYCLNRDAFEIKEK